MGLWFLAAQVSPEVNAIAYGHNTWPYQIIGVGLLLAVVGLLTWTPGLMVPASIVSGIGCLLYYQNMTGYWESWAYAWALIPGFVGIGLILLGMMERKRGPIIGGLWCIFSALILFGIFGWALGGIQLAGIAWPVALILIGLLLLFRPRRERRQRRHAEPEVWVNNTAPTTTYLSEQPAPDIAPDQDEEADNNQ